MRLTTKLLLAIAVMPLLAAPAMAKPAAFLAAQVAGPEAEAEAGSECARRYRRSNPYARDSTYRRRN